MERLGDHLCDSPVTASRMRRGNECGWVRVMVRMGGLPECCD